MIRSNRFDVRTSTVRALRLTCLSAPLLFALAGCRSGVAPPDDNGLASKVQGQISADGAIAGQPVKASVQNGVATLTGNVANDAQRTIAARDAAGVTGVREVINNLTIGNPPPASASAYAPPPTPIPAPIRPGHDVVKPSPTDTRTRNQSRADNQRKPAPIERTPPPPPNYPAPVQQTPVAPQQPVFRMVTVPAGGTLPVRITQTIDSETAQAGGTFSGVVASDIIADGVVAIPAGSAVSGRIDAAQDAGHFQGASLLSVSLASVSRRGDRLQVSTEPYTVQGKGRGRNTVEKAAGGAAVGAILGGIFGGGKGAAIGAAAGGGVGAGSNAITRGQQVQIASESIVRFRTTSPITVRVRSDAAPMTDRRPEEPVLQPR